MKYTPNSWSNGFTADVQITNTGSSPINGWTLTYNLPAGPAGHQRVERHGEPERSAVTARNIGWNGSLAPGGTASFGYQGTLSGAYSSPTSFTLNGVACSRS